jgi:hypothetical protein
LIPDSRNAASRVPAPEPASAACGLDADHDSSPGLHITSGLSMTRKEISATIQVSQRLRHGVSQMLFQNANL